MTYQLYSTPKVVLIASSNSAAALGDQTVNTEPSILTHDFVLFLLLFLQPFSYDSLAHIIGCQSNR